MQCMFAIPVEFSWYPLDRQEFPYYAELVASTFANRE